MNSGSATADLWWILPYHDVVQDNKQTPCHRHPCSPAWRGAASTSASAAIIRGVASLRRRLSDRTAAPRCRASVMVAMGALSMFVDVQECLRS